MTMGSLPLEGADVARPPGVEPSIPVARRSGQFSDVWRRYRRNKLAMVGVGIVGFLTLVAIFEPLITPYDPMEQNLLNTTAPPSADHLFGTDTLGRDMFSGVIYGTRLAIIVGLSTMALTLAVGVTLGALAGYRGRFADALIMRITDIFLAFPPLIAAIIIVRILGAGVWTVIFALAVVSWTISARVMRGQVLALREAEYVEAARSIGASDTRIVLRHILPNAIAPVLILAFSGIGATIVGMASLAYLGIGVPPDIPEWGQLIAQTLPLARVAGTSTMWLYPSMAIVITTLGFAFVADGLRDALDPKLR
jgi:peptide/nickel transport system permease protein